MLALKQHLARSRLNPAVSRNSANRGVLHPHLKKQIFSNKKCRWGDLNPHGSLHMHLKHARLPFRHIDTNLKMAQRKPYAIKDYFAACAVSTKTLKASGSLTAKSANIFLLT